MPQDRETGPVLLALSGGRIVLGAAVARQGDRFIVFTESGTRETWTDARVVHVSGRQVPAGDARAAQAALGEFRKQVEARLTQVDLPVLWELCRDEEDLAVEDLAGLAFPEGLPEDRAAVAWALALDDVFFKATVPGRVRPHSAVAVEEARVRRFRQSQDRQRLDEACRAVRAALEGGDAPAAPLRQGIESLKALAVFGEEGREGQRGSALLAELTGGSSGDAPRRAFDLLVRLGVFAEDEVLGLHRQRIRVAFPEEVLEEARRLVERGLPGVDRRPPAVPDGHPVLAIDDPWTRDVDDALAVEAAGEGRFRVHVLIADPTSAIPLDGELAREASIRAGSLYLPNRKVPMLPEVLSEGILSLDGGPDRPALDFQVDLLEDGSVERFEVRPVRIPRTDRWTYDEVDRVIQDPGTPPGHDLRVLSRLADAMRQRRLDQGAMPLDRDDVTVRVIEGRIVLKRQSSSSAARRLVQEFMVLACTLAGRLAREEGIPVVYRRQDPPEERANRDEAAPPGTRAWLWQRLRTLRRAEWTSRPEFHYGLGVVGYAQVTSPLRRFQDFLTHGQLRGWLLEGRAPLSTEDLLRRFGDLEAQGEALTLVEREGRRYWLLRYLEPFAGQVVEGEVVGRQGSRALVELAETMLVAPVPGLGHLALGSPVQVRVREVDPRGDRLVLAPA
ncbi:RNB domain-containing ribonuclease [Myxococcota bacterium]|nr:RNB domain-containing ribonuclease [Myxococcota bacterium]